MAIIIASLEKNVYFLGSLAGRRVVGATRAAAGFQRLSAMGGDGDAGGGGEGATKRAVEGGKGGGGDECVDVVVS